MANPIKQNIPNAVTCLNLLSGCVGVVFAFRGQFDVVAYCMLASGFFDLMDGLVARALGVSSAIGRELDSLADVVSFGFLPGVIYFQLLTGALSKSGTLLTSPSSYPDWLPYLGFIVVLFSAIRLAKFNLDERQQSDFIGLNTPMNAFYVLSLAFIAQSSPIALITELVSLPLFLVSSIVLTSSLLVSEIRLFSMKSKSLGWQENQFKYLFLLVSAGLLVALQMSAIPVILILYFGFSALHFRVGR